MRWLRVAFPSSRLRACDAAMTLRPLRPRGSGNQSRFGRPAESLLQLGDEIGPTHPLQDPKSIVRQLRDPRIESEGPTVRRRRSISWPSRARARASRLRERRILRPNPESRLEGSSPHRRSGRRRVGRSRVDRESPADWGRSRSASVRCPSDSANRPAR